MKWVAVILTLSFAVLMAAAVVVDPVTMGDVFGALANNVLHAQGYR